MILDAYYGALRELLATGNPDKVATKIGFGTGTEPERKSDTALTDPFIKELSGYELDADDPRLLRVSYRLLRGEANGKHITEIGLYTADETLIVRKMRSAIEKTPDMEFGDTWEILI
jgi:hypothetical protein